jgi:hypothetical protein
MGPLTSPGHIRALTNSGPSFVVNTLKTGDAIYFKKQKTQGITAESDCTHGTHAVNGAIASAIPTANAADETTLLYGTGFQSAGWSKVTLPMGLTSNAAYPSALLTTDLQRHASGANGPVFFTTCFVPAGAIQTLNGGNNCPVDSPNNGVGGGTNANGGTCNTTLVNAVNLPDDLQVFSEPTDALVNSWFVGHVYELRFTQPQFSFYGLKTWSCGQKGDIVVIQKNNCNGVHAITSASYTLGSTHSNKMVLEEYGGETTGDEKGGAAEVAAVAQGKVNELGIGIYKICYATRNSQGDDESDFKELATTFEILPKSATKPSMSIPRSALLGQDLVISWESTVNLQTRPQTQNSWIGLYRNGTCLGSSGAEWGHHENRMLATQFKNTQADYSTGQDPPPEGYVEKDQHECFVASQFIEGGVSSGVVRFSQKDYKQGGLYDVRFFQGDSRNGQGRICKGLTNTASETYVHCFLEAAIISGPISVFADPAKVDRFDHVPGMEVMFSDQRARFQKGSRGKK